MLHVDKARALAVLPLEEACALVFGGGRGVYVDVSGGGLRRLWLFAIDARLKS